MCKTNPIPGDAGWDEGANAQNEPNFSRGGPLELADRAKQTQFGGVKCAKRTQFASAAQELAGLIVRNKANFLRAGPLREPIVRNKANLLRGHARPSPRPSALTLPPAGRLQGPIVQNEPNLPGVAEWDVAWGTWDEEQMRKTKPILRLRISDGRLRIVRNKPNSCHYADPEIGVPGRASTWWDKSYGESYKQSQFAPGRAEEKAGAALWPAESLRALRMPARTRRRSRLRRYEGGSRPLR
jgi:hypothetical protein